MPNQKTKICLIGGTFDPIHLGHTFIAAEAVRQLHLDKVIFLPCKQSPHKLNKQNAPDVDRLEMCKLATSNLPWADVNDFDLTAPAPSYSWRTAEHFKKLYPNAELHWLMGTDQWIALPRWNRYQHLASLVKFIVFTRGADPISHPDLTCTTLHGNHQASATSIRNNPNSPTTTAYLNPEVKTYIQTLNLYQT